MVPAPTTTHQLISQNIEFALVQHVRATGCGRVLHAPVDVVLGKGRQREVVQPDVVFVSAARASIITEREVAGAPDLVVEVLSPGTVNRDRGYKRALYARSGVREYWIVDPKRKAIDVFRLGPTGFQAPVRYGPGEDLASTIMPELRIPLLEVFRD
jgi:Uma2 family endonuclease